MGSLFSEVYNDEGNNRFKYLYGMLTQTSAYENSSGNADWAKGELLNTLEAAQDAFFSKVEVAYFLGSLFLGGGKGSPNLGIISGEGGKLVKSIPYIKHTAFSAVRDKWNQEAAYKFVQAMQKGFVGKEGQSGIKPLTGTFTRNGVKYTHEIKVFDKQLKDYRIYGYLDKSGQYIFDLFDKALH